MGPFQELGVLSGLRTPFPYETDNPAPFVFPNGSVMVMFRSWHPPPQGTTNTTTPIGIARSDGPSWNSTYTLTTTPPIWGLHNATSRQYVPLEDPFMWRDEAGFFHAVFHNMGACNAVGCHAYSVDGWEWFLASRPAYTTFVPLQGGRNVTVARRERPHIVFNAAGQPAFLTNGVQDNYGPPGYDHSYTLVAPINAAWP